MEASGMIGCTSYFDLRVRIIPDSVLSTLPYFVQLATEVCPILCRILWVLIKFLSIQSRSDRHENCYSYIEFGFPID